MPLTTFLTLTTIKSSEVNANFALCLLKENVNTNGGILFGNGTTATQAATKLFWDNTNNRLGVGTPSPSVDLHVSSASGGRIRAGGGSSSAFELNDANTRIGIPASNTMAFYTSNAEVGRFNSTGNFGIGGTPGARLDVTQNQAANSFFDFYNTTNGGGAVWRQIVRNIANSGTTSADIAKLTGGAWAFNNNDTHANNHTSWAIGGTERFRLISTGQICINTTSLLNTGGVTGYLNVKATTASTWAADFQGSQSSGNKRGIAISFDTAPNTTAHEFIYCIDSSTSRFFVYSNGGIYNYSANNVNLSDHRVKKEVIDSGSYLSKINSIQVVKYKYKDQTHNDHNLGVIAQQVKEVAPEFVCEDGFGKTPDDGVPYMGVYESDLQYATLRAVQELSNKVNELELEIKNAKK